MTREDIIRMAREAQDAPLDQSDSEFWPLFTEQLEHFAALVAAAEQERMTVNSIHSCHPECDRPGCVAVRKAVEAEREACAEICERRKSLYWMEFDKNACDENRAAAMASEECADAIRARGSR
jgi:hypothetical protein